MMTSVLKNFLVLVGRILLSAVFIISGANHIVTWGPSVKFMAAKGMAFEGLFGGTVLVHILLGCAVVLLIGGGLSVLLGLRVRWGAVLLLLFLLPTTFIFHNFWASNPWDANQMAHFLKNAGLIGGLLILLAYGPGGMSIDALLSGRRSTTTTKV
jgi:putative oxidoreductase